MLRPGPKGPQGPMPRTRGLGISVHRVYPAGLVLHAILHFAPHSAVHSVTPNTPCALLWVNGVVRGFFGLADDVPFFGVRMLLIVRYGG